jgi:hypothetical protein
MRISIKLLITLILLCDGGLAVEPNELLFILAI